MRLRVSIRCTETKETQRVMGKNSVVVYKIYVRASTLFNYREREETFIQE